MSFGALSANAIQALNAGARRGALLLMRGGLLPQGAAGCPLGACLLPFATEGLEMAICPIPRIPHCTGWASEYVLVILPGDHQHRGDVQQMEDHEPDDAARPEVHGADIEHVRSIASSRPLRLHDQLSWLNLCAGYLEALRPEEKAGLASQLLSSIHAFIKQSKK